MFLAYIKLTNFRCLGNIEIDFVKENGKIRNRTLLIGQNGMGKSAILKAIALITAGSDALGSLLGNSDDWIKYDENICILEATLLAEHQEKTKIKLEIHRGDTLKNIIIRCQASLDIIDKSVSENKTAYTVLAYGSSRRIDFGKQSFSSKNSYDARTSQIESLFNPNIALQSIESWAIDLDYKAKKKGLRIIKSTLNDLLPNIKFTKIDKDKLQLLFKTEDGIIPLKDLSDGYQDMTAWIGDLLFRFSQLHGIEDFSLKKINGVLLLDELELHLNPIWQRNLLALLSKKFPNLQIITTTHSPITAQQAEKNELYYLHRNETKEIGITQFQATPQNFLLQQLVTSNLFNLPSDESLHHEQLKKEYIDLKQTNERSPQQERKFDKITKEVKQISTTHYKELITEEHFDLLKDIKEELQKG